MVDIMIPLPPAGGIRTIVDLMRGGPMRLQPSIAAMGCLSLMGLVRGEGELCQGNQWAVAKVGSE